jgi:two-component system chemotaxis sensor kinase CheA
MSGEDTELDKSMVEAIKDPLTHLIRNSVDHGIESPDVREAAGKDPEGVITIRAFHQGGLVNIEISDNGGGIDPEIIKGKAVEKGLISAAQAAQMSDREALTLIFQPGFSTAAQVDNVSGRGVGMDVVKTNVEKIGGAIDIISALGHGTTLKLKIPLTLAIVAALVVSTSGNRYAIPQTSLSELVLLEGDKARQSVEHIHGTPVYRLRGKLLPLVSLATELELGMNPLEDPELESINIVVLHAAEQQFGLLVDKVHDTEEIVVKPLGQKLKKVPIFAGATIMGDGKIALILDVLNLAQRSGVVGVVAEGATGERERSSAPAAQEASKKGGDATAMPSSWLIFRSQDNGRMAMPTAIVARLEEFEKSTIHQLGDYEVVEYRGQILPLVYISQAIPDRRGSARNPSEEYESKLQVVVYTILGRSVGLVVERILDIVEESVKVERAGVRNGVHGSALIEGRVTELVDVQAVIRTVYPQFFDDFSEERKMV